MLRKVDDSGTTTSVHGAGRWRRVAIGVVALMTLLGSACGSTDDPADEAASVASGTTDTGADSGAPDGSDVPYPSPDWPLAEPQDHGLDPAELDDLAAYFESINSTCTVVIKDGHLVDSRYWNGTTIDTNQEVWSISKSITSMLIGVAQTRGLLDIDDPASDYIEEWRGTPSEGVTIRNLVSNDSGRYYSHASDSGLVAAGDQTGYALALDQQHPPGRHWDYNSSAIQTLEAVLENATGGSVEEFAQEHLFGPLGMSATIRDDDAGNDLMYMGTQAGCDDIARFGYLALHGGAWDGEQVVSRSWMTEATSASQDLMTGYGFLWWRNTDGRHYILEEAVGDERTDYPNDMQRVLVDDGSAFFPSAPADLVVGAGIQDQLLLVVPSEDLVIVRLGGLGGPGDFLTLIDEVFTRVTL